MLLLEAGEHALAIVCARTDQRDLALDRARLEAIAAELANLVRSAAKVRHLDALLLRPSGYPARAASVG